MKISIMELFMREGAGKHFVLLVYSASPPGSGRSEAKDYFASCFVVEAAGQWFLVTAGHVIAGIKEAVAKGSEHFNFRLHDRTAGGAHDTSVPIPFDPDDWAVLDGDPEGTDYAAWAMPSLIVSNLNAGGVRPLPKDTWSEPTEEAHPIWVMVGVPHESASTSRGGITAFRFVGMLLERTEPPKAARIVANRTFARIVPAGDSSQDVKDITGMSGGPIFGVRQDRGQISYWVIGVQSSWFADIRVVSFCSAIEFLEVLESAVRRLQEADLSRNQAP